MHLKWLSLIFILSFLEWFTAENGNLTNKYCLLEYGYDKCDSVLYSNATWEFFFSGVKYYGIPDSVYENLENSGICR